jgi:hypothetical protein
MLAAKLDVCPFGEENARSVDFFFTACPES